MLSFSEYIKESAMVDELDRNFIKRAMKVTSFNLSTKDFESLTNKKEIQYLFGTHFFPKFDFKYTLNGVNLAKLNKAIDMLKSEDRSNFDALHKYNLKGVGPGEATLYFLINNGKLGGGSSAGIDLIVNGKGYEVKAVSVSADRYAYNFKLGGTFDTSKLINELRDLKKQTGVAGAEVNGTDIKNIQRKIPGAFEKIEKKFQEVTYNNYFKNHEIIFIYNTGPKTGSIAAIKKVQKSDIQLERVTSGVIKPRVKL